MTSIGYYFHITRDYADYLDGLRWSRTGEVVEYPDEGTFAFRSEIGLFLEGIVANRRLIHFGFILHLLHMLGVGKVVLPGPAPALYKAFRKVGRPLRNAGAFCAVLTQQVPAVPAELDPEAVCRQLYSGAMMSILYVSWNNALPEANGEVAPFTPEEFEAHVLRALSAYTVAEIEHWLRHGRGPIKGAGQLAQELEELPRALSHVLAQLTQRPRLAGAVPFVAQLVSALTLPPRRRTEHELPTGGYADVTTHGTPELLLPSQFALDDLEFLRRFAENELLYFRREEPHARTEEELVLLLDQGVRTWGDVRLLLSAAVLAFGRLAERRGMPLRIAGTSSAGAWLDPLEADGEELGELLDASDLTAHPGLALERVLEAPAERARDVVLLTHPRNLAEADVAAAARRAAPGTRLFALAVNPEGQVALSELKRGHPVPLSRFRVELAQPAPPPERPQSGEELARWTGDVEPIPLPFRIGLVGTLDSQKFDFDHDGEWLVALTTSNWLYAWKLDGSQAEILPRGQLKGRFLSCIETLVGVAGGCVLGGLIGRDIVAFHYQFGPRRCVGHRLGQVEYPVWDQMTEWCYFREYHTLVVVERPPGAPPRVRQAVDLAEGEGGLSWDPERPEPRLLLAACQAAQAGRRTPPRIPLGGGVPTSSTEAPQLWFDGSSGLLRLTGMEPSWLPYTPVADGKALLRHAVMADDAKCAGGVLVVNASVLDRANEWKLHVFRGPEGTPVAEYKQPSGGAGFALSRDGRLLARLVVPGRLTNILEVRDLTRDTVVRITPRGRRHPGYLAELGQMRLALFIGKMTHLIEWHTGRLEVSFTRTDRYGFLDRKTGAWIAASAVATEEDARKLPAYDPHRYLRAARGEVTVLIDNFGQAVILDAAGELVCIFFAFRERLAAWMPDGTRFGPTALTGGPETPDARERIGRALYRASELGRGRRS